MSPLVQIIVILSQYGTQYVSIISGLVIFVAFLVLHREVSGNARGAFADWVGDLVGWLEPAANNRRAVARAICELFDRIYTVPLFTARDSAYTQVTGGLYWTPLVTRRAFLRSAFITLFVTFILTYVIFWTRREGVHSAFLSGIPINIVCDYLALYVIRMWLATDDEVNAREALFIAPLAGILLVISFMGLRLVFFMTINLYFGPCYPFDAAACKDFSADSAAVIYLAKWDQPAVQLMSPHLLSLYFPGVLAACLVHLWLPLFALCVGILKFLYHVLHTVEVIAQRFRDNALQVIGFFAFLLTMTTVALLQWLAAVLHLS